MINRTLFFSSSIRLLAMLMQMISMDSIQVFAQKSLSHSDYARWNNISEWIISASGSYASWVEEPGRGDNILHIKNLNTGREQLFKRGSKPIFSGDETLLVAPLKPPFDTLRKLKIKKVKDKDLPQDSLLILNLINDQKIRINGLKDFNVQKKGSLLAALAKPLLPADSVSSDQNFKTKSELNDLLIYHSASDSVIRFHYVAEFFLPDSLPYVLWIQKNKTQDSSTIMLFKKDSKIPTVLYTQKGTITKPAMNDQCNCIAFLSKTDTSRKSRYGAYLLNLKNNKLMLIVDSVLKGHPEYRVSDKFQPWFSKSGEKLFLGYSKPLPEPVKDTLPTEEKPRLDLWSWTDPLLQPQQIKKLEKDKNKAWLMMYSLKDHSLFVAANDSIERVETYLNGNSDFALGYNYKPYQILQSWDDTYYDIYLVDFKRKTYQLLLRKHNSDAILSPDGQYFTWYKPSERQWYLLKPSSGKMHCLTCDIEAAFYNPAHDLPSLPPSNGFAGWTSDNRRLLINSDLDIWAIDPEGKTKTQNLTANWRKGRNIRFRYLKENPEAHYISNTSPLLLYAFFIDDKSSGYFRLHNLFNHPFVDSLIAGPFKLGEPLKARLASKYLFKRESFKEFPDIWACNENFDDAIRISDANPWQKDYKWGNVKLVKWTSLQGKTMEGLLYTPDNFTPTQKYPMVVYFYERNADELHRYILPRPSRSIINQAYLASNDYLVFVPDIVYGTGNPGQDAFDCVVSGVSSLIDKGFVDEKHIGIQGQSWGGYQTAYIITRTNMFACAMAGAPVSNMTSAYGGIRWESGMSRMFQYEKNQSRIGGTLWDKPLSFINNSPIFFADRINTPLLIMSNDQDGAVPWYQGIELFTSLRRLEKPCWMLVYNEEEHNLKANSWGNRMDLTQRMYQFFDHYLKNQPAPRWMIHGIPAEWKGIDLGF